MIRMIFINLPVRDPRIAEEFYINLGFSSNQHFSDDHTGCVVLSDNIVVMLRDAEGLGALTGQPVADPFPTTTVVNSMEVESRELVDEIAGKAERAGAKSFRPWTADDFTYLRGFSDPDGNQWQVMFMEPRHIID